MPALFSSGGSRGTLGGAAPRGYSGAFGGVPGIPSPIATAGQAITGNIGNLGSLYQLGGGLNQFQTGQAIGQLAQGLPNYGELVAQSNQNIGANLRGEVPSDVITEILQGAAERGIITGTSGSPNSNAAYLRALGLTSLGLQQQGEQELSQAIARTPRPPLFDPNRFFVTPEQQQEAQTAANYMAAAPIPQLAGNVGLGAAQSGLRAGLGSVSAPARNPFAPTSAFGNPFEPQTYSEPPMIAGGALGYTGEAPNAANIAANWAQWAQGMGLGYGTGSVPLVSNSNQGGLPLYTSDALPQNYDESFADLLSSGE